MNNTTSTYHVEIASPHYTPGGLAMHWASATPHAYKTRKGAERFARSLGCQARVVAK